MLAVPAAMAVTAPFCVTVATDADEVLHCTALPAIVESRWSRTVAVSVAVAPTARVTGAGVTDTVVTTGVKTGVGAAVGAASRVPQESMATAARTSAAWDERRQAEGDQ